MKSGIIVLDKKIGITSMASDSFIKRLMGTSKVGHHGTLDPFATGVLPIYVGDGLKVVRYADDFDKTYECVARFGVKTDSQDLLGEAVGGRFPSSVELEQFEADDFDKIRSAFTEASMLKEQTPPIYSAKKINGQKAYELARKGIEVELKPHPIEIYKLSVDDVYVIDVDDNKTVEARFTVHCSKGTYIRSICDFVGDIVGLGAHAVSLRRLAVGCFDISMAHTEEELKAMVENEDYSFVLSRNLGVNHLPKLSLNKEQAADVRLGRKISAKPLSEQLIEDKDTMYAAYLGDELIAVLYPSDDDGRKIMRIDRMLAVNA